MHNSFQKILLQGDNFRDLKGKKPKPYNSLTSTFKPLINSSIFPTVIVSVYFNFTLVETNSGAGVAAPTHGVLGVEHA